MDFGERYDTEYKRSVGSFKTTYHNITDFGLKITISEEGLEDWNGGFVPTGDVIELKRHKNSSRLVAWFYRLLLKI